MLVLLARGGSGDEVRDSFGQVAMVLCAVLVDCFLNVSSLLRCDWLAIAHILVLIGIPYDYQNQSSKS